MICETALPDETATVELAGQLAAALPDPAGNWLIALQGELVMRYAEKLDQLPVAGKAEEMRLIQVNTSNMPVFFSSIWST